MNYLSDLIAWGSERDDIDIKLYQKIEQMPLPDILKLYDESTGPEGEIKDRKMERHIRAVIADKLELPQRDIIVPFISDLHGELNTRLVELERWFRNHRHDASKEYTEKPAW